MFGPIDDLPTRIHGVEVHPRRLLVHYQGGSAPRRAVSLRGVRVLWDAKEIGWLAVETSTARLVATRQELRKIPGIDRVDYDRAARAAYTPSDPLWSQQTHYVRLKLDQAWNLSRGSNVTVAVLDTGILASHPDLAANVWQNTGEIANNGIDDDGNGYIDDRIGYDFTYDDSNPDDVEGHGTACSGLVAEVQNNGQGGTGPAPFAKVMTLKVATDAGLFYDSATVPAYIYGANMGAKIFSCSFFSDAVSTAERDALSYAVSKGVLPVVAAGNFNEVFPTYPSSYEMCLSVGATNTSNLKASFSNLGSWIDVAAPGTSLTTTTNDGSYTSTFAGTSGSCPQVAGIVALLKGANPSLTTTQIGQIIEDTATSLIQSPYGEWTTYGLVDANAAMQAVLAGGVVAPRTPQVKWMSPIQPDPLRASTTIRIHGRGFQSPNTVQVMMGNTVLPIIAQTRDYVDVRAARATGATTVRVNGSLVASIPSGNQKRLTYSITDMSGDTGTFTGGFAELAQPGDALEAKGLASGSGNLVLEGIFQGVQVEPGLTLVIKRRYVGTSAGTETLSFYDWDTASYPYATFLPVSSVPVSSVGTGLTTEIPLTDIARYVDFDGVVYFKLSATGIGSGKEIDIDQIQIVKKTR